MDISYTITELNLQEDTVSVRFNFSYNDKYFDVTVPVYRPQTADDAYLAIANRITSEIEKSDASDVCSSVVDSITLNSTRVATI